MNTNIVSVCSNRSLNPFSYRKKLLTCSISQALLFGRVWRMDLVYRNDSSLAIESFQVCPVSWLEGKKFLVLANIRSKLFINIQHFIICEPNNWQRSSRKLLFLLYKYPNKVWQYRLANCT